MYKKLLVPSVLAFVWLFCSPVNAQNFTDQQLKQWSKEPVWIQMIDDPNANYFETVAAYEAFWKNREMPVEEDQILRMKREDRDKVESRKEKRQRERKEKRMEKEEREDELMRHKYAFAVKKYNHWKLTVEPYVQSDGRILSKEEQLKLHLDQR